MRRRGPLSPLPTPSVLPLQYGALKPGRGFCGLCRVPVLHLKSGAAGVHTRMSQQPESTSSTLAVSPAQLPGQSAGPVSAAPPQPDVLMPQRIPRWLVRLELILRVMLRLYIGLAVCYAPWSPVFWDRNPLFQQFPALGAFAAIGAVRGLVSGMGLLNLWIALQDVIGRWER